MVVFVVCCSIVGSSIVGVVYNGMLGEDSVGCKLVDRWWVFLVFFLV